MSVLSRDRASRSGSAGSSPSIEATLEVPEDGFVGLIGPNGAGKTTLFNAISGFIAPTRGTLEFAGTDITKLPPSRRAKLGIGRTFQKLELFARMTVFDNLHGRGGGRREPARISRRICCTCPSAAEGGAALRGDRRQRSSTELGLGWARDRRASRSPGRYRAYARARPRPRARIRSCCLLDEPSSGLDTSETRQFGKLLQRINGERGIAILLVEHDMDLVMEVCKEIYVLDFGRMIAHGTPKEIAADPAVRTAYLGEEDDDGRYSGCGTLTRATADS